MSQHFIRAQEVYETLVSIADNIQTEFTIIEGTNRFFINQDDAEACLGNIEALESASNLYSAYNQDVERKGELVRDGSLYPKGPVKNMPWQSIINNKLKTNLPLSRTLVGDLVTRESSQLKSGESML